MIDQKNVGHIAHTGVETIDPHHTTTDGSSGSMLSDVATGTLMTGATGMFTAPKAKELGSRLNKFKAVGAGGLGFGLASAPITYASRKLSEKYDNDEKFNAGHFGALMATGAANATIMTGAMSHANKVMSNFRKDVKQGGSGGKFTTALKNSMSPKGIWDATKADAKATASIFSPGADGKRKWGKGAFGLAMTGLSFLDPVMYALKDRSKNPSLPPSNIGSNLQQGKGAYIANREGMPPSNIGVS